MIHALPVDVLDHAAAGGRASWKNRTRKVAKTSRQCRNEVVAAMKLNKEPELKGKYAVQYDLWAVKASDLHAVVVDWAERRAMDHMSACIYISSELGCHEDVIYKLSKKAWVSFTFADALLVVIGRHFSIVNGEVPYYANPYMSKKTWYAKARADGIEYPAQEWILNNPNLA